MHFYALLILCLLQRGITGQESGSSSGFDSTAAFESTDLIKLTSPSVSYEELLEAATKLHDHEFDDFYEAIGFPKREVEMEGYVGISQYNVSIFRGIKYGEANRFERSRLMTKPDGKVNATHFGPSCPQPSLDFYENEDDYSEDCLYLDMYVPDNEADFETSGSGSGHSNATGIEGKSGFPVIIAFQGEGFSYVESRKHDARLLARFGNVIVVVVNYRTGVLGFLSSGDGQIKGNFGLYDQRTAIEWVKKYAGSFGGDTNRITLLGFSSGAESISAQMSNPDCGDLFQRVILQSGVSKYGTVFSSDESSQMRAAKHIFEEVAKTAECGSDRADCLLTMDTRSLVESAGAVAFYRKDNRTFGPVKDENYFAAMDSIDLSRYEIMIGTVDSEAGRWVNGLASNVTLFNIIKHVLESNSQFFCAPERIIKYLEFQYRLYTETNNETAVKEGFIDFATDYNYRIPALTFANKASMEGAKTYVYQFEADITSSDSDRPTILGSRAIHGDDQPYLFGVPLVLASLYSSDSRNISANYIRTVTNFAHSGDPNSGPNSKPLGMSAWEPYSVEFMGIHRFAETLSMIYRQFAKRIGVWTEELAYFMSSDACKEEQAKLPESTSCSSMCKYSSDWEKNYVKWRDVEMPRWRDAAEKYEQLVASISTMVSSGEC